MNRREFVLTAGALVILPMPAGKTPFAFTKHEGGLWRAWDQFTGQFAAIWFDDNTVYDAVLEQLGEHPWRRSFYDRMPPYSSLYREGSR